jgi:hypothetical protein
VIDDLASDLYDQYLNEWDMQRCWFHELPKHKQDAWERVADFVRNRYDSGR